MKKILFVSALVGLSLFACKKEQASTTSTTKPAKGTTADSKILQCSPWQDEADMQTAIDDLNAIVLCNTASCSNGSPLHTFEATNQTVKNSAGTADLQIPVTATGDMATQNYIWGNAVGQSSPPPGYSFSRVHNFSLELHHQPLRINWYTVHFDITYIECGSGGGGN